MKNIIVEGMDGSGKDTLIAKLLVLFPTHKLHERASTSLGGPVDDLAGWVTRDIGYVGKPGRRWVYNRHPLISEPAYALVRKNGKPLAARFEDAAWVAACRRLVSQDSVLVICQPSFEVVTQTLQDQGAGAHLAGVWEGREYLWSYYASFMWPGVTIRYDYTKEGVGHLAALIEKNLW